LPRRLDGQFPDPEDKWKQQVSAVHSHVSITRYGVKQEKLAHQVALEIAYRELGIGHQARNFRRLLLEPVDQKPGQGPQSLPVQLLEAHTDPHRPHFLGGSHRGYLGAKRRILAGMEDRGCLGQCLNQAGRCDNAAAACAQV
jgi:hypothetical protein